MDNFLTPEAWCIKYCGAPNNIHYDSCLDYKKAYWIAQNEISENRKAHTRSIELWTCSEEKLKKEISELNDNITSMVQGMALARILANASCRLYDAEIDRLKLQRKIHREVGDEAENDVLKLQAEIERLKSGHAECRRTEQKLREANRRLQASGEELERDKYIIALKQQLAEERTEYAVIRSANNLKFAELEATIREFQKAILHEPSDSITPADVLKEIRAFREQCIKLGGRIKDLELQLLEAYADLQHYGPTPPNHVCGTPNASCDTSCQEFASFCDRLDKIRKLLGK